LVLLTLVLLVLVAVLIKATSRGPVLFRQPRVGQFNQVFTCYKFRTMRHEAADLLAEQQTIPGDPRITPLGRWLRRTSIDELPQLLNVIKGDMSLVGPRPHAPRTKVGDRLFHEVVPHYHHRHAVLPGITGWAQVNGLRGQTSTEDALVRRVDFDMHYIHSWSLWFDLRILVMTAMREIYSKHAF
jgi:lipopolysaccharide/colanic/teichoic acid biosynthesis glycosyltransferase